MKLRAASPADATTIAALATQVFLDTYATSGVRPDLAREAFNEYSVRAFAGRLADARCRFVLAEEGDALVGFAEVLCAGAASPVATIRGAELVRLYVQPRAQRSGIGRLLIAEAERLALDASQPSLWLTVWEHNANALAFYRHMRYDDVGATTYSFEGRACGNRVFAKRLVRTFQRFTAPDPEALLASVTQARVGLEAAEQGGDLIGALDHAGSLVGMLTTLRREAEAYEIGARYVEAARSLSESEVSAWLLHALATAAQYLDRRDEADVLFGEALGLCRRHGWRRLEHFVLHHRARSKAEVHDFGAAEAMLREALAIRVELNEKRAQTTRSALEELDRWRAEFDGTDA